MKKLVKNTGATMMYDETNNRIKVEFDGHTTTNEFKHVMDQLVNATDEHGATTFLADARKRTEGNEESLKYSIKCTKKAFDRGLLACAIVNSEDPKEQKFIKRFSTQLGNKVHLFKTPEDANDWLDRQDTSSGSQSKAA